MGHCNIGITALYYEVSDEMMRNAVELVLAVHRSQLLIVR